MLPTPSTSHVDIERIYEPAEDSYLLLDVLSSACELEYLTKRFGPTKSNEIRASPLVLEVGTGSGVVLAFVNANARIIFGTPNILSIGTDINKFACSASQETVRRACEDVNIASTSAGGSPCHGELLTVLNADLTSPFRDGMVDVLIFNPPYVPSEIVPIFEQVTNHPSTERTFASDSHLLSLSYEGGRDGMEVTNRLLDQLPSVLSNERGVAYLLLCKQNEPERVADRIKAWGSAWSVEVVGKSGNKAGWEKLQVIRISRQSN